MYRTILLAYDGTLEGRLALREGARLAQLCGARVVLLAIVEYGPEIYAGDGSAVVVTPDKTDEVQKTLDEGAARLVRMGFTPDVRLERGLAAACIKSVAQEVSADLVVVGHHKQGPRPSATAWIAACWLRAWRFPMKSCSEEPCRNGPVVPMRTAIGISEDTTNPLASTNCFL